MLQNHELSLCLSVHAYIIAMSDSIAQVTEHDWHLSTEVFPYRRYTKASLPCNIPAAQQHISASDSNSKHLVVSCSDLCQATDLSAVNLLNPNPKP